MVKLQIHIQSMYNWELYVNFCDWSGEVLTKLHLFLAGLSQTKGRWLIPIIPDNATGKPKPTRI